MSVGVLLCGIGGYGENYIKQLLSYSGPEARLLAIVDPFAHKSQFYSQIVSSGIPVFDTPQEFFKNNHADLTIVSSPIHTHYSYIMTALRNNSNVLTEKPVCFNSNQYDEMQDESTKRGLFTAVGYQMCFSDDVLALKRDIIKGVFGKPVRMKTIRLMRRNDVYYGRNNWAGAMQCNGEIVYDSPFSNACAHQYQNMVFLLGSEMNASTRSISCRGSLVRVRPGITNCDTVLLEFVTEGGVELFYYASHAVDTTKYGPYSEYEFEKAVINDNGDAFTAYMNDGSIIDYSSFKRALGMEKLWECVRCVEEKRQPVCVLKTSREHTNAVFMAQRMGVSDKSIYAVKKTDSTGSFYYTLPDLDRKLQDSYESWSIIDL